MDPRFVVARSLLHQPPSAALFQELTAQLEGWSPAQDDPLLRYLRDHLARWPSAIERVAPTPWLQALGWGSSQGHELSLANTLRLGELELELELSPEALRALLAQPALMTLRTLDLEERDLRAALHEPLLDALAHGPLLERLGALRLGYRAQDAPRLTALFRRPLPQLRSLDLRYCALSDEHLEALLATQALRQLHTLRLQGNPLTDRGVARLAQWPDAASLRWLDLRDTGQGDQAAQSLASSPHLSDLERLDLSRRALSELGIRALATSKTLREPIRRVWRAYTRPTP